VRILTLDGNSGDHISCVLCTVDIGKDSGEVEFEALSYCWGDGSEKPWIVCDEHVVAIGVNLVEALFYLRVEGEDRSIWVDALCINQEDLNERSIQVAEMARIYQRAQRVIAFIGPEMGWEETAFTFLHELSEHLLRRV
jgi:hypothetical protein